MDKAFMKQASEWFDRGNHDIETAQLIYDNHGYTDSITYHIQQVFWSLITALPIFWIYVKKRPDTTCKIDIHQDHL